MYDLVSNKQKKLEIYLENFLFGTHLLNLRHFLVFLSNKGYFPHLSGTESPGGCDSKEHIRL